MSMRRAAGLPPSSAAMKKGNHRELAWRAAPPGWRRSRCLKARVCSRTTVWRLPALCEAMIAFLATASIGGVMEHLRPTWARTRCSTASARSKVLISVDGVTYGGRDHDHTGVLAELRAGLPACSDAAAGQSGSSISIAGCANGRRLSPK